MKLVLRKNPTADFWRLFWFFQQKYRHEPVAIFAVLEIAAGRDP